MTSWVKHCPCCDSSRCCYLGSIPGPGTSVHRGCGQKKKKKEEEEEEERKFLNVRMEEKALANLLQVINYIAFNVL